jgi:hypothetical protein
MNHTRYFVRAVLIGMAICSLATFLAKNAPAQINSGVITGMVTDPQGAAVPNAKVEVVEDSTKFSNSAATNDSGEFTVPYLKAGTYTVTVTATGFPVFRVTGVNVVAGSTVRTDVPLRLSTVSTQVEVSATADQLQSDSTTVEGAVGEGIIDSVPNTTQNPLYYATLLEGVIGRAEMSDTTSPQSFGIGYDGRRYQSALNVDGASAFSTAIQLDGLSVTSGAWNEASVLPNTDSLQEVRVVSSNFTAEFGRGMGVVKMATKSGTNQFHGSAYDRVRNEAFNANTFKNNANAIPRGAFKVNDFGGTVGGPIIKDKLFFFTSYELMRHNDTPQWMLTVPTAAQRIGDFSQTVVAGTNGLPTPVTIWNPNIVTPTTSTNVYQRAPYPNSIIPHPDPRALKIMAIYPLPNWTPTDAFGSNNFFTTANRSFSRSSNNSRMDYRHGRHSVYASGGVSIGGITTPSPYGADSPWYIAPTAVNGLSTGGSGSARYISDDNPYVQLGDTLILSPTVVLDARGGVNRIHSNYLSNAAHTFTASDYASYGVPASVQAVMPDPGTALDISPGFYSNAAWAQYNNKHERQTNSQVSGSVTKMRGKWTLKAGAEYRVYQGNYTDYQFSAARYQATPNTFTVQYINAQGGSTQNNTIASQGFAGAQVLAGGGGWLVPANQSPRPALTAKYAGLFTQNDWHATSRLTVNVGLRWEIQPAPTDRFDRSSALDLTRKNSFGTLGTVVFPGNNGLSRSVWKTTWTNLEPRIGLAYRIDKTGNWVVRGGYGEAYGANNTGWYDGPGCYNMRASAPGTQNLPYGTSPNGTLVGNFWDAAASPIIPAVGPNSAAPELYGTGGFFFNVTSERPPRVQMWNVFIERRLSRGWFVSAGYTGSHGSHLLQARYPLQNNQNVPAGVLDSCRQNYITSNGNNPCAANVQNPLQPATGALLPFVGTIAQRTIPMTNTYYPYLALLTDLIQQDKGWSDYNSLKIRVRHSTRGFVLDANYTWSKSTDTGYTELQDYQGFSDTVGGNGQGSNDLDIMNWKNDKKLSYSDVPHRVVMTLTYELPFGKGRQFALGNHAARAALSGWRIGSVFSWQRGFPLAPTGANGGSLDNRPNLNVGPNEPLVLPKNLQGWYDGKKSITLPDGRTYTPCAQCYLTFNPDAFTGQVLTLANGTHQADLYWTGNAAIDYGAMRGPGRNNLDLTLMRDFRIRERYSLSFSARVANALNHTQFRSGSYTMALGAIQVNATPAQGLLPGEGQGASTYGSHNMNTYDPRQMTLEMRLRF